MLAFRLESEPYVEIEVEGIKWKFIVDTGAAISVVKPDKWQARLIRTEGTARGVTGDKLNLIGKQNVLVKLGTTECQFAFWVGDIGAPGDGILGVDFLQLVGASVDLHVGCLRVGKQDILLGDLRSAVQVVATPTVANEVGEGQVSEKLITSLFNPIENQEGEATKIGYLAWVRKGPPKRKSTAPSSVVKIVQGRIVREYDPTEVPQK